MREKDPFTKRELALFARREIALKLELVTLHIPDKKKEK